MKTKLDKLLNNAYSPYSKVNVASILVTNDKKEYNGVNVENASFGATICAERNSIIQAISDGKKSNEFMELHLTSNVNKILFPCGICRQVMNEFFGDKVKIFIYYKDEVVMTSINKLSPNKVEKNSFDW